MFFTAMSSEGRMNLSDDTTCRTIGITGVVIVSALQLFLIARVRQGIV